MEVEAIIPRRHRCRGRPWNLGKKRWMVDRTMAWFNDFGRAKLRMEKKADNLVCFNYALPGSH
jgi:hypothetical protein